MRASERLFSLVIATLALAALLGLAWGSFGCTTRTYNVYLFGDSPSIRVDAAVDKEISVDPKVSLQ